MISYIVAFAFPVFVIIIGLYYLIARPKPDNKFLGYRTERSMMNMEAWKHAQFIYGRQLLLGGAVAAVFGYGMTSVNNMLLKVILFLIEFISVTFFGMFTEFILRRDLGR